MRIVLISIRIYRVRDAPTIPTLASDKSSRENVDVVAAGLPWHLPGGVADMDVRVAAQGGFCVPGQMPREPGGNKQRNRLNP